MPLSKPLSECKIALVTTSGLIRKSDKPFDIGNTAGDPTYRIVPTNTDPAGLIVSHTSTNWDRTGFAMNTNANVGGNWGQIPLIYLTNPRTSLNTGCSVVRSHSNATITVVTSSAPLTASRSRSEERRVGKECARKCRSRWSPYH